MKSHFRLFFLAVLLTFSCNHAPVPIYDISGKLDSIVNAASLDSINTKISICKINPKVSWDSLIVVCPYSGYLDFAKIDLENFFMLKRKIIQNVRDDGKYGFVFVKGKKAISYCVINRPVINFFIPGKQIYAIKNSQCDALYLKLVNNKYNFTFTK